MTKIDNLAKSEIIPAAEKLQDITYHTLIGPWMENLAQNLPKIRKGLGIQELPKKEKQPILCLAGGPSIEKYRQFKQIKKWKHPILCCDKMLNKCLKHDIKPYVVASLDGSPLVANMYKGKLVRKYCKLINAAFCVTVHPKTVKMWKGNIYWFVAMLDELFEMTENGQTPRKSVTVAISHLTRAKGMISGLGNVGAFLVNLAAELGGDPIVLVGYDFSEQVKYKEESIYWTRYVSMFQKAGFSEQEAKDKTALLHQVEKNPDFGTYYLVNPIWKSYRIGIANFVTACGLNIINATGNGCLHTQAKHMGKPIFGSNFSAKTLEQVLKEYSA